MKNCNKCGALLPDEAKFCTSCGSAVEQSGVVSADQTIDDLEGTTVLDEKYNDDMSSLNIEDGTTVLNPDERNNSNSNNYYNAPSSTTAYQFPIQQPEVQQYTYSSQVQQNTEFNSLEEFYNQFASKKTKNWLKSIGIISIVTAVLSLGFLVLGNYLSVIDVIFYAVFSVLLFKKKNWVFPLIVTCYSGLFTLIGFVMSGTPSGIFALVAGMFATKGLKNVEDAYKVYTSTGQLPGSEL